MGKPILYALDISPPVRAIFLTAKAIGLDLDVKEVDLFAGKHVTPDYLKINPQHTVPTLDDNGKIIWDSHAIATYLIGKYAKDDSLYPKDLYQRALIDQRLHFDSGILYTRLRAIVVDAYFGKRTEISEENIKAAHEAFDFLEKFLEKDLYMVGNSLTVADFCCVANTSSLLGMVPFESDKYPNILKWVQRLSKLPYYEELNGTLAKKHIDFYKKHLESNKK